MEDFSPTVPGISVCMVVKKAPEGLHRALVSLENQKFSNFELLIAHTDSAEDTARMLSDAEERDIRISLSRYDGLPAVQASANLLLKARGEYVFFMDPTSWLEPRYFADLYALAHNNDLDLVMGGYRVDVTGTGGRISTFELESEEELYFDQSSFRQNSSRLAGSGMLLCLINKLINKSYLMRNRIRPREGSFWQHAFVMDLIKEIERVGTAGISGCMLARTLEGFSDVQEAAEEFERVGEEYQRLLELYGSWGLRKQGDLMAAIHGRYIEQLCAFFEEVASSEQLPIEEVQKLLDRAVASELTRIAVPRARLKGSGAKSMLPLLRSKNTPVLLVQARLIAMMRRGSLPTMAPDAFV